MEAEVKPEVMDRWRVFEREISSFRYLCSAIANDIHEMNYGHAKEKLKDMELQVASLFNHGRHLAAGKGLARK
jgi:hypothetical protein